MGLTIHLPTLLFLSVAINLLIGGLLWTIYYLRSRQYCFLLWAMACGTFAIGSLLAGLQVAIDAPWLTGFTALSFLGLSPLLLLGGLQRFLNGTARSNRRFCHTSRVVFAGYLLAMLIAFQFDPLVTRLLTALFSAVVFSVAVYCLAVPAPKPALPRHMLQVLFALHGVLMMVQCLVITMSWLSPSQTHHTGTVLRLILVNHILLATATALVLPLLAFTRSELRLRALAEKDGLTELLNRRSFFLEGNRIFETATHNQQPMAVLMLDLDHFKKINDRWGHATGDKALQTVARTLEDELRDEDIIGRIGGEEFAIVLQLPEHENLQLITHRLLNAITRRGANINGMALNVTASIGSIERADRHQSFTDLMLEADTALYGAKDSGRNRAEFGEIEPSAKTA